MHVFVRLLIICISVTELSVFWWILCNKVLAKDIFSIRERTMIWISILLLGIYNGSGYSNLLLSHMVFGGIVIIISVSRERQLELEHEQMLEEHYQKYVDYYQQNHKLVHDIKNHLLILKKCEENKEYVLLKEYLDEIQESYQQSEDNIKSGNWMLDTILNIKKNIAEQKKIQFDVKITQITALPFDNTEVCVLLGNLLDNAIEANEQVLEAEKRFISVEIKKQNEMLYFEISNRLSNEYKDNQFHETSKDNKLLHGIGLKSVKRIVQKYNGVITHEILADEYRVCCSFFDKGEN